MYYISLVFVRKELCVDGCQMSHCAVLIGSNDDDRLSMCHITAVVHLNDRHTYCNRQHDERIHPPYTKRRNKPLIQKRIKPHQSTVRRRRSIVGKDLHGESRRVSPSRLTVRIAGERVNLLAASVEFVVVRHSVCFSIDYSLVAKSGRASDYICI